MVKILSLNQLVRGSNSRWPTKKAGELNELEARLRCPQSVLFGGTAPRLNRRIRAPRASSVSIIRSFERQNTCAAKGFPGNHVIEPTAEGEEP